MSHVLVVVRGVGCQHHPAAACVNTGDLQAVRMAGRGMQHDARRDLDLALVHLDTAFEIEPHHADHVLDVVAVAELRIAHVLAGGIGHLARLQVEARVGKLVEVADVVVVHVSEDDIADVAGIDADELQAVDGAAQEACASAPWPSRP